MTARSIDKRTDNILIGAGEVYLDIHERGAATGERYLGDAVGAELEVAAEETTVFSGSGPVARELTRIARSVTRTARLTLHDISLENLALFTVSEMKRLGAASQVSDEATILRPGRWYQLGGADRPAGVLKLATPASKADANSAVTVTSTAAAAPAAVQAIEANRFAAGASEAEQKGQYIVDYARARIFWLPADHALYEAKAGVEAGTALAIDYTPDDAARDQVQGTFRRLDAGAGRRPARALHRRASRMTAEHELSVLFPDRDVTVRDPDTGAEVPLTVREFRFREGLEATVLARPLIAAQAALVTESGDGESTGEGPDAFAIENALATHAALWLELTGRACGRDADWLARLGDADGRALSEAMWGANGEFFCAAWRRKWRAGG